MFLIGNQLYRLDLNFAAGTRAKYRFGHLLDQFRAVRFPGSPSCGLGMGESWSAKYMAVATGLDTAGGHSTHVPGMASVSALVGCLS